MKYRVLLPAELNAKFDDNRFEHSFKELKKIVDDINDVGCGNLPNEFVAVKDKGNRRCEIFFMGKEDNNYLYGLKNGFIRYTGGYPRECVERLYWDCKDGSINEFINEWSSFNKNAKMSKEGWNGEYEEINSPW